VIRALWAIFAIASAATNASFNEVHPELLPLKAKTASAPAGPAVTFSKGKNLEDIISRGVAGGKFAQKGGSLQALHKDVECLGLRPGVSEGQGGVDEQRAYFSE
jgi:hypothetical protein